MGGVRAFYSATSCRVHSDYGHKHRSAIFQIYYCSHTLISDVDVHSICSAVITVFVQVRLCVLHAHSLIIPYFGISEKKMSIYSSVFFAALLATNTEMVSWSS